MKFLSNIEFWSAICGFVGGLILYEFGLPPQIHPDGHGFLLLEQVDKSEIQIAASYAQISELGVLLLVVSFLLQIIHIIKKSKDNT